MQTRLPLPLGLIMTGAPKLRNKWQIAKLCLRGSGRAASLERYSGTVSYEGNVKSCFLLALSSTSKQYLALILWGQRIQQRCKNRIGPAEPGFVGIIAIAEPFDDVIASANHIVLFF